MENALYWINKTAATLKPGVARAWEINDRLWRRIERSHLVSIVVSKKTPLVTKE